jgi:hypothetical protein
VSQYQVYWCPKFPIVRVLQAIVVPKGNGKIYESWKYEPWPEWGSPRNQEFEAALEADIALNGVRKPILLWDYAVVRGGSRLRAAHALGIATVPVLLSLSEAYPSPDAGCQRLSQIAHPAILGSDPVVIVWRRGGPLWLEHDTWTAWKGTSAPEGDKGLRVADLGTGVESRNQ